MITSRRAANRVLRVLTTVYTGSRTVLGHAVAVGTTGSGISARAVGAWTRWNAALGMGFKETLVLRAQVCITVTGGWQTGGEVVGWDEAQKLHNAADIRNFELNPDMPK